MATRDPRCFDDSLFGASDADNGALDCPSPGEPAKKPDGAKYGRLAVAIARGRSRSGSGASSVTMASPPGSPSKRSRSGSFSSLFRPVKTPDQIVESAVVRFEEALLYSMVFKDMHVREMSVKETLGAVFEVLNSEACREVKKNRLEGQLERATIAKASCEREKNSEAKKTSKSKGKIKALTVRIGAASNIVKRYKAQIKALDEGLYYHCEDYSKEKLMGLLKRLDLSQIPIDKLNLLQGKTKHLSQHYSGSYAAMKIVDRHHYHMLYMLQAAASCRRAGASQGYSLDELDVMNNLQTVITDYTEFKRAQGHLHIPAERANQELISAMTAMMLDDPEQATIVERGVEKYRLECKVKMNQSLNKLGRPHSRSFTPSSC